jgi:Holliday junction resolvase RusA-like endonuclease
MMIPIPPSVNGLWRSVRTAQGVRVVRSKAYRSWRDLAVVAMRLGVQRAVSYPVAVRIEVLGGRGWTRTRDLDNVAKAVLDALVASERIVDDSTAYVRAVLMEYVPPASPRAPASCVVTLEGWHEYRDGGRGGLDSAAGGSDPANGLRRGHK